MVLRTFIIICLFAVAHPKAFRNVTIKEIDAYITRKLPDINPRWRLHYHVIPPVGWLSDPNGFSYYKGQYHIFYQFHPYDSVPGPMHWGHSTSSNLVDWKSQPTALVPEDEICFSGGAVVDGDTMVLMYTGRVVTDKDPYFNETQYLAFSNDGIQFTKYKGNPVLKVTPPDSSPDFRDPKIWKHGDHWYAVIGSKTNEETGRALLYRSLDMIDWEFLSILGEFTGKLGYMWECPDIFELNGRFVFLCSPQGMEPEGDRYKNIHQTGYFLGNFSYETFQFIPETEFQELDFGHDFYASQTTEKDGKRYVVAWFDTWETVHPEAADGWAGALTMFRELDLVGDTILMKPAENIKTLRGEIIKKGKLEIDDSIDFEQTGEIIINAELEGRIVLLITGRDGGDKVWVKWDPEVRKVVVDRDGNVRQVEWSPIGSHSWRLFLDASSLELFCGEGEVVFSTRAYPIGDWSLTNLSPQVLNVEAYRLRQSVQ